MLKAVARLLRPLVRLLIRSGITFPVLADMLRGLYVEVATKDELPAEGRTDSRITLLTGVHRKEVRRLRLLESWTTVIPPAVSLGSQVIARWLGSKAYVDRKGRPLVLPRVAAGHAPSFESLVASVTTDIRPRAVLDGLLGQRAVTLDAQDRVHLEAAAYLPAPGSEAQLFYFARNLHDHLQAASANVLSRGAPPFLERAVHYDRLTPAMAARLSELGREAAQDLLVSLNRAALEMLDAEDKTQPTAGAGWRFNLGVYLLTEEEAAKES